MRQRYKLQLIIELEPDIALALVSDGEIYVFLKKKILIVLEAQKKTNNLLSES